ncbi:cyclopropane-fatty-acyl-phospholipid synthase [Chaetomium fimeti]|uniref:Cyclopropane-fatty-acyl-phospholipid synthase n=1 Tax=Chaetomium fimeti TaxID=1854472 RepID=A0AAE0HCN3_9PEZI|nr:cyclopropane-fatty-acyl-phospholipid synthase [Chaetomium fimeti]
MAPSTSRFRLIGFLSQLFHGGATYLRNRLSSLISGAAYPRNRLRSIVSNTAIYIARPVILSHLSSTKVGTLILIDEPYRERHVFGRPLDDVKATVSPANDHVNIDRDGNNNTNDNSNTDSKDNASVDSYGAASLTNPIVTLTVTSPLFYPRLLLLADMGFAESYLLEEVTCDDLTAFFRLFVLNRARLSNGTTRLSSLLSTVLSPIATLITRSTATATTPNTAEAALRNAAAHYDLGNDLFAAFLSPDMTYSCPIWPTKKKGEDPLSTAQHTKLTHLLSHLHPKPTDHILEVGTGWGSLAIEAARQTGCRVTSVTLSRAQKAWAEKRVREAGLEGRVRVLLRDYRGGVGEAAGDGADDAGRYDKIVSVEMVEAVGKDFLATYFRTVDRLLKKDGGIAVFQCITMPEGRQAAYEGREDFINRYIFPGGYIPSVTQLLNHITTESKGTLVVENVENIGGHYAKTLRLWRERFLANFEDNIRPALMRDHPDMNEEDIEVFRRKWEYYFSYCEAGFQTKTLGDVIITVGREGAMELMEGIPL